MQQMLWEQVRRQVQAADGSPIWKWVGLTVAVGVAYFLAARLSLLLLAPTGVAVFWPAAGISSGILIALGRPARWPVAIGVIVANIPANLAGDRNVLSAGISTLSDAGEALLVAWIIERSIGSRFYLGRLRHVLVFVAAALAGTAVSGIGGTLGYKLGYSPDASAWTVWRQWVASDAIGIIAVAPLIIGAVAAWRKPSSGRELVEGAVALVAVAAIAGITIFLLPADWWEKTIPVVLLFPVLLWIAARCRPVFAAAAVFIVSFIVIATITFGVGNYGDSFPSIDDDIISAQITIVGTALCALILSSLFAERRRHAEQQKILMAELDHRVKNVLARVAAVADSTRQGGGSTDEFIRSFNGRIQSMAVAHTLLSETSWRGSDLAALVRKQLAPYTTNANVMIAGTDIILGAPATQALAMVLHELVTNAVKYGALSIPGGRVSVSWERKLNGSAATNLSLVWREVGGPPVAPEIRSGYGTGLIRELIPHELGGNVDLAFRSEGACCRIELPLEAASRASQYSDSL
jgi:two-component sensor histidine kinase